MKEKRGGERGIKNAFDKKRRGGTTLYVNAQITCT